MNPDIPPACPTNRSHRVHRLPPLPPAVLTIHHAQGGPTYRTLPVEAPPWWCDTCGVQVDDAHAAGAG